MYICAITERNTEEVEMLFKQTSTRMLDLLFGCPDLFKSWKRYTHLHQTHEHLFWVGVIFTRCELFVRISCFLPCLNISFPCLSPSLEYIYIYAVKFIYFCIFSVFCSHIIRYISEGLFLFWLSDTKRIRNEVERKST